MQEKQSDSTISIFECPTRKCALDYINKSFNRKNGDQFKECAMTHSSFVACKFINVSFYRAAVTGSIFKECVFINCNFNEADLEYCDFENCTFDIKLIKECSFNNSNFINLSFSDIKFQGCTFTGSYFYNCKFKMVKIEYSTLEGACFDLCGFYNLDWRELNLEYIELIAPEMSNVVLPFYQIPYIFGALQYLRNTTSDVRVSNGSGDVTLDTYFEKGIPTLIDEYIEKELYFPLCNLLLFGRKVDYNKALIYLEKGISALALTLDFRGVKFYCKLLATCELTNRSDLNKIYSRIANADLHFNDNHIAMRNFTRHIGEIRNILFRKIKVPFLKMRFMTNVEIEHKMRFSYLINQFYLFAKPQHTNRVNCEISLSQNSPLYIEIKVTGDKDLFPSIIESCMILADVPNEFRTSSSQICRLISSDNNELIGDCQNKVIQKKKEELRIRNIFIEMIDYCTGNFEDYPDQICEINPNHGNITSLIEGAF